ncbi:MAG: hypothetical protein HQL73_13460 [Magnetococcales bacterium]|nr:hypothetical protein [Magnetococcales bacterium]
MDFDLQPNGGKGGLVPPVRFSFDPETKVFSGPDATLVSGWVKEALDDGEVWIIPCYSHPLSESLTLKDLGAILGCYWDLSGTDFPIIDIPEDPDMPEGAVN